MPNQPTAQPTKKVTAGVLGAAVAAVLVWFVGVAFHVDIPAEVGIAIATIFHFAAAYFTPED